MRAGDGGADCENESSDLATSSSSSSGSEDAPLSFLTMHPTRPRGEPVSESEAEAAPGSAAAVPGRGVTGPMASISRQRWMSDEARGPAGGSSEGALVAPAAAKAALAAVEEASEGAGDGSRKTAARAVTGRVAEASSDSSASLARRGWSAGSGAALAVTAAAAAAHRSRIWRRRLGVGSLAEEEEEAEPPAAAASGEEVETRMLKKPLDGVGREGSLHEADSWGMAATEEAMAVGKWSGRQGGGRGESRARGRGERRADACAVVDITARAARGPPRALPPSLCPCSLFSRRRQQQGEVSSAPFNQWKGREGNGRQASGFDQLAWLRWRPLNLGAADGAAVRRDVSAVLVYVWWRRAGDGLPRGLQGDVVASRPVVLLFLFLFF